MGSELPRRNRGSERGWVGSVTPVIGGPERRPPLDFLPFFYVVGIVSIALSSEQNCLGDRFGGTIAVRRSKPGCSLDAPSAKKRTTRE